MISAKSIALAESIAVSNHGTTARPVGKIIQGLNEVSYGSFPYTEGFREEIQLTTQNNGVHTDVMDATTSKLAEVIRGAFDMVKQYGVPFAKALACELEVLYTPARLNGLSTSQLDISYINVDDPFFESPLYPTEVKNTALDPKGIRLDALDRLEFGYASKEELLAFLNVSHPDALGIIDSPDYSLQDSQYDLKDLDCLKRLFVNNNGVFDFTQLKSIQINRLLKMYFILTKMYVEENPVPWLNKGSLADYREYVSLFWNGMTRYLISLKQIAKTYQSRLATLVEIKPIGWGTASDKHLSSAKLIKGDVVVFYTKAALDSLVAQGVGLSEWVLAIAYCRVVGNPVDSAVLLKDGPRIKGLIAEYRSAINQVLTQHAEKEFVQSAKAASLKYLVNTAHLNERVKALCGDSQTTDHWFNGKIGDEFQKAYYAVSRALEAQRVSSDGEPVCIENDETVLNALLGSALVPTFLRAIDCGLAAEIIEETYVNIEANESVATKRERLHVALIKVLTRLALKP